MKHKIFYITLLMLAISCGTKQPSEDEVDSLKKIGINTVDSLTMTSDSLPVINEVNQKLQEEIDSLKVLQYGRLFYNDFVEINNGPPLDLDNEGNYYLNLKKFGENLRESSLFTNAFIESEVERFTPCATKLEESLVKNLDDSSYINECDLLEGNYWFLLDQKSEGVKIEVLDLSINGAQIVLRPYYYSSENQEYVLLANLILKLKSDGDQWYIDVYPPGAHLAKRNAC